MLEVGCEHGPGGENDPGLSFVEVILLQYMQLLVCELVTRLERTLVHGASFRPLSFSLMIPPMTQYLTKYGPSYPTLRP